MRLAARLAAVGAKPWTDAEITPGANWGHEIGNALDRADVIVILLSPDWVASDWAQAEVAFLLRGERFAGRIVPVMIRRTSDYPWILNELPMIKLGKGRQGPRLEDVVRAVTSAAQAA